MTYSDFIAAARIRLERNLAAKWAIVLGSLFGVVVYLVNGQDWVRAGIGALIMGLGGWYLGASFSQKSTEKE